MSEADWWLCPQCQSLNNLSARKCYSCRKRKPKNAVRASEQLGYQPVVDENGKVSLEGIRAPSDQPQSPAETMPSPLRDPVLRDTLAVAPQPPRGARITYRMAVAAAPLPPPSGFIAPGQPGPRPLTPVGPGPAMPHMGFPPRAPPPVIADAAQQWPHWRELLDVAKPQGDRLRAAYVVDIEAAPGSAVASAQRNTPLSQAMSGRGTQPADPARRFIPWPEADRLMARSGAEDAQPSDDGAVPQPPDATTGDDW